MSNVTKLVCAAVAVVLLTVVGWCWGYPHYNVWSRGMEGEARLRQATQEKQIMIEQARAELEASKLRAEAIESIGEMAQRYPEYRNQEFMGAFAEALKEGNVSQIIYVPTEANLPVLEAGHR